MKKVTKTYTITFSSSILMKRFERLLALFHFNSGFGHSGKFGMPLDGDGSEKISVDMFRVKSNKGSLPHEVNAIAGAAYSIDVALDNSYSGFYRDKDRESEYRTGPAANLYKKGEIRQTIPSRDYEYDDMQEHLARKGAAVRRAVDVIGSDHTDGDTCAPLPNRDELGPPPEKEG